MRLAKVATLGLTALLVLACGGVQIPTIPPIPSFSIPPFPSFSIPPIPSGLFPSGLPTPGPDGSIDPNSAMCRLLTSAEVSAVMGAPVTVTEGTAESCTWTATSTFATLNIRADSGDLSAARFLLGDTAQDVNIGGHPGLKGTFIGSPLIYLQRGNDQLVFQGVLFGSDAAEALTKLEQLANVAAPRW